EFRLWALLTEQSRGQLHVFLPLTDRGIDALVHRLTDGSYLALQAKSRSTLQDGEVHIVVWADGLVDDQMLIVSSLIVDGGLGPTCLVIPVVDFKRLANRSSNDGVPIYSAEFGMRPRSDSKWLPWLVPTERLAERFGVAVEAQVEALPEPRPEWRSDLGYLGETEVTRRLAEAGDLNAFRPFPDLETAEIAVLDLNSRRVIGLQVKTVDIDQGRLHATVNVRGSSFRPSPTTFFTVLAWLRDESRFHEEFLLIPSMELREFLKDDGRGHLQFVWHPGSTSPGHLDVYKHKLTQLNSLVSGLLSD
ncbi:MAG TPA: hypothetical protein VKF16_08820, partial [Candidatus Dormibacteraeota bacterium]|nr:hypothetical protein [Candidatus Dormibacteraeota bacterium]